VANRLGDERFLVEIDALRPQAGLIQLYGRSGSESRVDLPDLDQNVPMHRLLAEAAPSVACVVPDEFIKLTGAEARVVVTRNPQTGHLAVSSEGTAFLLADKGATCLLVTAGHVVSRRNLRAMSFVFDYTTKTPVEEDEAISFLVLQRRCVMHFEKVVYCICDGVRDIAVLEVANPNGYHARPLALAPRRSARYWQEVGMLGHASGQPVGGIVRHADGEDIPKVFDFDDYRILTNLDSYQGCSGSPILDASGRVLAVECQGIADDAEVEEDVPTSWATRVDVLEEILPALGIVQPLI
jgi:hypothetical protein